MTHEEFQNWVLFNAESPIDDLHTHHLPAARIAWMLANINRDTKKQREPYPLTDFLPPWWDLDDGEPAEPVAPEVMREKLEQVREYVNT